MLINKYLITSLILLAVGLGCPDAGLAQTPTPDAEPQPVVEAQVITNSPVMLSEPLQFQVIVTHQQPLTITALPPLIEAVQQTPASDDAAEAEPAEDATPTPEPEPAVLRFELDQARQVAPRQTEEGQIVEPYHYRLVARPERVGAYRVPALTIRYRTAGGKEIEVQTEPTELFVLHPNTANLDVETDYRFLIAPASVLGALLLLGLGLALYLKRRKPRALTAAPPAAARPPIEVAHDELAAIAALHLPDQGEFKRYYSLLSETVRKFLGAEFCFPVLERTTDEVLAAMQQRAMPHQARELTGRFLREADLVKFAKYTPRPDEAAAALEQAYAIVDESVRPAEPETEPEAG